MIIVRNFGMFDQYHEMGMGYHFARATSGSARGELHIVLNGVIGLSVEDLRLKPNDEKFMMLRKYIVNIDDIGEIIDYEKVDFEIVSDIDIYYDFLSRAGYHPPEILKRRSASMHSSPPFVGACRSGDRFVRFSAFRADRRVRENGTLLAGSYCTSESDRSCVPNALSAVGRYALPNIAPPVHVFEILPPPSAAMNYGTVVPNFGQAGGGAEMEFHQQLPTGSVVYKGTIAEW